MLIMMFSEIDHVHLGPWNLRIMVGHSLTSNPLKKDF